MRIQVLHLPDQYEGAADGAFQTSRTPFALIFDEVDVDELDESSRQRLRDFAAGCGAASSFVTNVTVEVV